MVLMPPMPAARPLKASEDPGEVVALDFGDAIRKHTSGVGTVVDDAVGVAGVLDVLSGCTYAGYLVGQCGVELTETVCAEILELLADAAQSKSSRPKAAANLPSLVDGLDLLLEQLVQSSRLSESDIRPSAAGSRAPRPAPPAAGGRSPRPSRAPPAGGRTTAAPAADPTARRCRAGRA